MSGATKFVPEVACGVFVFEISTKNRHNPPIGLSGPDGRSMYVGFLNTFGAHPQRTGPEIKIKFAHHLLPIALSLWVSGQWSCVLGEAHVEV